MKYKTHNDKEIDINMSHGMGYITATYKSLVKAFGKPTDSDGYKVDAEWDLEFEDGTIGTIYNYKTGKNYLGKEGLPKTKITDWHIGGFDPIVVDLIKLALLENGQ